MAQLRPIDPQLIWPFLDDSAERALDVYFNSGAFTGGQFDRFAGGGDRQGNANTFTAEDIVAVSMLSVRIPGRAALRLLDGADELDSLLSAIPTKVDLWDVREEEVGPGSAANQLWELLESIDGIGWVTAGKLMARKRPRVIPVYDRVVRDALERRGSDQFWQPLRSALADNKAIVDRLGELRATAGLDSETSLIRTLDVAIWMKAHGRPEPVPDAES